ncbi:hypothetical protein CsSME_00047342 [Camellia sinensis var. sinensis]
MGKWRGDFPVFLHFTSTLASGHSACFVPCLPCFLDFIIGLEEVVLRKRTRLSNNHQSHFVLFIYMKLPCLFFRYGCMRLSGDWIVGSWWDVVQVPATVVVVKVCCFLDGQL